MPKRFTATEKWDDPWFFELSDKDRIAWIYLLDKCNHAGIWVANWKLAEFYLRAPLDVKAFGDRVVQFREEKYFIPKFIEFQYGTLSEHNRAHQSVLMVLKREGVEYKGHISPIQGDKDKDKAKDKDKDKDKEAAALLTIWNDGAPEGIQKALTINHKRAARCRAVLEENSREVIDKVVARIRASSFCKGKNDRGWQAGFDWFLQADTFMKVLEGKYDDRKPVGGKIVGDAKPVEGKYSHLGGGSGSDN